MSTPPRYDLHNRKLRIIDLICVILFIVVIGFMIWSDDAEAQDMTAQDLQLVNKYLGRFEDELNEYSKRY